MLCPVTVRKKDELERQGAWEGAGILSTRHLQLHAVSLGVKEGAPAPSSVVN